MTRPTTIEMTEKAIAFLNRKPGEVLRVACEAPWSADLRPPSMPVDFAFWKRPASQPDKSTA